MSGAGDRAIAAYRRTLAAYRSERRPVDALFRTEAATAAYTAYHDARREDREPIAVRNAAAQAAASAGRDVSFPGTTSIRETGKRNESRAANPAPGDGWQTARELAANPPPPKQWRVRGLIPKRGLVLVSARPKVGKSTWTRALAASVTVGRPFMDRATERAPALLAAFEGDPADDARHIAGLTPDPDGLHYGRFGTIPEPLPWLHTEIDRTGARLAIVDTVQRWLPVEKGDDYSAVTNVLGPVDELARTLDCTIVLVHHERKEGGSHGAGAIGSTAWAAVPEAVITLERRGESRVLSATIRSADEVPATVVELTDAGDVRAAGTMAEQARATVERDILAALDAGDAWRTLSALAEATGHGEKAVRAYLKRATDAGLLLRRGEGRRNKPFEWALARRASDSFPGFPV